MKKLFLLICVCMIGWMTTGCEARNEKVTQTVSNETEIFEETSKIHVQEKTLEKVKLPRSYSYLKEGRMPVLRDQGDSNTCWAYASLSALESSSDGENAGPYSVDHLLQKNPFKKNFENGGSYVVAMSYLLSWEGPVLEETASAGKEMEKSCVHVQEVRQIETKDYETMKKMIYLYGGVESALYVDFDQYLLDSSYYNKKWNSYCYPGNEQSNHDVVIVGWDDDYPAERFLGTVENDGAFLCLSSWGEKFGNRGTFYVSYEDVNLGTYGIVYTRIEPVGNYDRIFQSDLCGYTAQSGYQQETAWFANVYTPEENVELKAAGFYATGKDTDYEIYLVPQFANEHSFMMKQQICSGSLEEAGYYTIDFPESYVVEAGNAFGLAVKITTKGAEYPVAIECRVDGLSEKADLSDGQGYLSFQGKRWEHVEETKNYNICLKVYADLQ